MRPLVLIPVLLLAACGKRAADTQSPVAFTAVAPVANIMERVGSGHWAVHSLVGQGKDPHTFALTPRMVTELSAARLYVSLGIGIDDMVESRVAAAGEPRVVHLAEAGQDDDDPHVWLDPEGIVGVARAARDAYSGLDPDNAAIYAKSCMKLEAELRETESMARKILAPWKGRRFYVQHDAFTRFAACFGLEQVALEDHDKEPGAARIADLVRMARVDGVKVLYAQQGHNPAPLKVMAAPLGAFVQTLDPLYPDPVQGLLVNARILARGFEQERVQ